MARKSTRNRPSYSDLLEENKRLRTRVSDLEARLAALDSRMAAADARVAALEAQNKTLREQLEEARRAGKRQATPFAKNKRKAKPKRPGRKPGQGTFKTREAPTATEPTVEVPVIDTKCPDCGGKLKHTRIDYATLTELPEIPKPKVTPFDIEVCTCSQCGKNVRGKHADLADDQYGASAHRFGKRALAAAHNLHYGLGVTVRKVPEVLRILTGLRITQGAITQDALRQMRGPVGKAYQELRDGVRYSNYVHTDDTGWRTNATPEQLMVFETTGDSPITVFQIRRRHRNEEVRELIPGDYKGTMTTDRGKSYDAEELRDVKQNKCVSHIKRNISSTQESQPPGARLFGNRLKAVIDESLALWRDFHDDKISLNVYHTRAGPLRKRFTHLLRNREMSDLANQRLLNGLGKHDDAGNLLRFLEDPYVEPTNNRAERALRPAVIARKVSQCSKNTAGAEAHAGFMSIFRTLKRRGLDALAGLTSLLTGDNPLAAPAVEPNR